MDLSRSVRQLAPVHPAGQPHIADEKIDCQIGSKHPQRRCRIISLQHGKAHILQSRHHQHADERLVVDHQDGTGIGSDLAARCGSFTDGRRHV